jgi:hypothetical protein
MHARREPRSTPHARRGPQGPWTARRDRSAGRSCRRAGAVAPPPTDPDRAMPRQRYSCSSNTSCYHRRIAVFKMHAPPCRLPALPGTADPLWLGWAPSRGGPEARSAATRPHIRRPPFAAAHPAHVTLRLRRASRPCAPRASCACSSTRWPRRCAPRLPPRPLLAPVEPRPSRGRGDGPDRPRTRDEGARDAARAACTGPSGAAAQCSRSGIICGCYGRRTRCATSCGTYYSTRDGMRGGWLGAASIRPRRRGVRRLGAGGSDPAGAEAGGTGADVAAAHRVATARPDLAGRRAGPRGPQHAQTSTADLVASAACPGRAAPRPDARHRQPRGQRDQRRVSVKSAMVAR